MSGPAQAKYFLARKRIEDRLDILVRQYNEEAAACERKVINIPADLPAHYNCITEAQRRYFTSLESALKKLYADGVPVANELTANQRLIARSGSESIRATYDRLSREQAIPLEFGSNLLDALDEQNEYPC